MEQIAYNGYKIQAAPYKSDIGDWIVNFYIHLDQDGTAETKTFAVPDRFETRDAAVKFCFDYGKEIIDAEAEGHYFIE